MMLLNFNSREPQMITMTIHLLTIIREPIQETKSYTLTEGEKLRYNKPLVIASDYT
jgi:hypothetical protein